MNGRKVRVRKFTLCWETPWEDAPIIYDKVEISEFERGFHLYPPNKTGIKRLARRRKKLLWGRKFKLNLDKSHAEEEIVGIVGPY